MNYKLQAMLDLGTRSNDLDYAKGLIARVVANGWAQEYKYFELIGDKPLDVKAIENKLNTGIVAVGAQGFYLKHQDYFTYLSIKDSIVILIPLEPFKTKADFNGKADIDIAFYINQLLNLCDDIQLKGLSAEVI
jgi:hypothetical protein